MDALQDRIRGSLVGGAIGDAPAERLTTTIRKLRRIGLIDTFTLFSAANTAAKGSKHTQKASKKKKTIFPKIISTAQKSCAVRPYLCSVIRTRGQNPK